VSSADGEAVTAVRAAANKRAVELTPLSQLTLFPLALLAASVRAAAAASAWSKPPLLEGRWCRGVMVRSQQAMRAPIPKLM
jgi:hypothetical protein